MQKRAKDGFDEQAQSRGSLSPPSCVRARRAFSAAMPSTTASRSLARPSSTPGWPPCQEIRRDWRETIRPAPYQAYVAQHASQVLRSTTEDQFMNPPPGRYSLPQYVQPLGGAGVAIEGYVSASPPLPMTTHKTAYPGHLGRTTHRARAPIGSSPYASVDGNETIPRSTQMDAYQDFLYRPAPPDPIPNPVNKPPFSSADAHHFGVIRSTSTDTFLGLRTSANQPATRHEPICKPSSKSTAPYTYVAGSTPDPLTRTTSKDAFQMFAYHAPARRFRVKPRRYGLVVGGEWTPGPCTLNKSPPQPPP